MSFKLFFLRVSQGLRDTYKVERFRDILWADYQSFIELEKSEELKQFLELEKLMESDRFKRDKAELRSLCFKGSLEEKILLEYSRLEKNKKLRNFYDVQDSAELKRFLGLSDSEEIRRYQLLRKYVEDKSYKADQADFKRNKKKGDRFEDTDAFRKFQEYSQLKSSADVVFWQKYPKTALYRNYQKMIDSAERSRFEELRAEITSAEYQARKAYLEDPRKWEKSELCQQETTFLKIKQQPRFVNYLKYRGKSDFDFFRNWNLVFEDHFDAAEIDRDKWQTVCPLGQKTLGHNFSKAGDLQAYTKVGNISQKNSHLLLSVKKENVDSFVWNMPFGFTPSSFKYSAGLLTTGELFQLKYGMVEAKIKYQPRKQLVDLFYLTDSTQSARLNLFESGAVCRMGYNLPEGKQQFESLRGLKQGQFYIFSVEWEPAKVIWKINNREIFVLNSSVPNTPMSLNARSILVESMEDLPHYFEVDWVRCWQKKS